MHLRLCKNNAADIKHHPCRSLPFTVPGIPYSASSHLRTTRLADATKGPLHEQICCIGRALSNTVVRSLRWVASEPDCCVFTVSFQ